MQIVDARCNTNSPRARKVGEGAYAQVYAAVNNKTAKLFAVKTLWRKRSSERALRDATKEVEGPRGRADWNFGLSIRMYHWRFL